MLLELDSQGTLIVNEPTGFYSGVINSNINTVVGHWNQQYGLGYVADSSTLFTLPNGAKRSPDLAWLAKARVDALPPKEKLGFANICPDFVVELRSKSDRPATLKEKMEEYMACGAKLGWLIDPFNQEAFVYKPNQPLQTISPLTGSLTGGTLMPGLVVPLSIFSL